MATVIQGMTYVRYEAEGGAMVRRLSPPPSRTVEAEQICAAAQTGKINDADVTVNEFSDPNAAPTETP
jgi:hypothetical protein